MPNKINKMLAVLHTFNINSATFTKIKSSGIMLDTMNRQPRLRYPFSWA